MKYIKKPIVIEAEQFKEFNIAPPFHPDKVVLLNDEGFYIKTLEGPLKVSEDDFIIKGVKGEYYPCKPDIFKLTYDPFYE